VLLALFLLLLIAGLIAIAHRRTPRLRPSAARLR
jgi:hypothetical protein